MKRLTTFLIVLVIGFLGYFFAEKYSGELAEIQDVSIEFLVLLLLATFLYILVQGLILNSAVKPFSIRLKFYEWFGILVVTLFGNYVFPLAGVGFRAAYLKTVHNFPVSKFFSTLAAIYVLELLVFSLGGMIGIWAVFSQSSKMDLPLLLLFGGSFLGLSFLLFLPSLPYRENKIWQKVKMVLDAWNEVKANRKFVFELSFLTVLEFIVYSAMFYITFLAYGWDVSFLSSFLVAGVSDFAFFIRFAPGALGTYDATILYSSKVFGLSVAQGMITVALIRCATLFWLGVLGPVFSFVLVKKREGAAQKTAAGRQED